MNASRVLEQVTVKSDGWVGLIGINEFFKTIGCSSIEELFKKNKNNHERRISSTNLEFKRKTSNVNLTDLIFIKQLGFGQFGRVLLTKSKSLNRYFAIKMISLESIQKNNAKRFVLVIPALLLESFFPFFLSPLFLCISFSIHE